MEHPICYKKTKSGKAQSVDSLLIGGLFILLLLAGIFWQERVFIIDAAYQSFILIENGGFPIQHQRYGGAIAFFLPFILIKLHAPFALVLAGYSISFALYPILFYLLLRKLRLQEYAWSIGFIFIFITAHTFFWIQNEIIIATVLSLLTVGLASHKKWSLPLRLACLFPLTLLTIYTHPLGAYPLVSAWLFLIAKELETNRERKKIAYYAMAIGMAIVAFIIRQFLLNSSGYDQAAMGTFSDFIANLPGLFGHSSMDRFMRYSLSTQLPMVVALVFVINLYIRRKNWWRLTAVVLPFFMWLVLIVCTWPWAPDRFYIESYYYIFASILALPFTIDVLPQLRKKWWIPLIGGMILFRIVAILISSSPYQTRLEYLTEHVQELQELPQQRLLIQSDNLSLQHLKMDWALSFETLLLSTYIDPSKPRTIMAVKGPPPDYCQAIDFAGIPTATGPIDYGRLVDQPYIRLQDTGRVEDIGLDWK